MMQEATIEASDMSWDYAASKTRIRDLYEAAKEHVWNAGRDLSWDHPAGRQHCPVVQGSSPLQGFAPFEALCEPDRIRLLWLRHGLELSDVLHGEQGALLLSAQLVSSMPTVEAKLFASSQVNDEARHVEFFSRYLNEIVGEISLPGDALRRVIRSALDDPRWELKMITCQILIESLALSRFQQLQHESAIPLLRSALSYIVRDEARHVSFGTRLLQVHMRRFSEQELDAYGRYVLDSILSLSDMDIDMRIADTMGWDRSALRFHLRCHRLRHPECSLKRFRLLARNLDNVGLLRGETKRRLADLCA